MPNRSTARKAPIVKYVGAWVGTFVGNFRRNGASAALVTLGASLAAVLAASPAHGQNLSERLKGVAEQRQQAASRDTSKASLLGALLYTDLTVDFKDRPAKEAIQFVSDALGVPLVGRYSSDRVGAGIDPDTPITLKSEGKPALTVLEMILDQCGTLETCTWQLRDSFIEVGTKERLSVPAARELRMYPVKDILFEAPLFNNAPDFNLNSAIQQAGQNTGGQGGGSGGGGGGFGGGGGGGGFGGGGGGSGSGGGGQIFGDPGDAPEMPTEEEKAEKLVNLILESVEPEAWVDNGGESTIRFYQGVLVVRAPDFVHRQLGGYPFAPRPAHETQPTGGRYVTFTAPISIVENVKFRDVKVTGAAGGSGRGNGGNGGGGGGGGGGNPAPPQSPSSPNGGPGGGKGAGGGGKGGK